MNILIRLMHQAVYFLDYILLENRSRQEVPDLKHQLRRYNLSAQDQEHVERNPTKRINKTMIPCRNTKTHSCN